MTPEVEKERLKDANERMQERIMQLEQTLTQLELRLHDERQLTERQSYLIDGLKAYLAKARNPKEKK